MILMKLISINFLVNIPWFLCGDMNVIDFVIDKLGGRLFSLTRFVLNFKDFYFILVYLAWDILEIASFIRVIDLEIIVFLHV